MEALANQDGRFLIADTEIHTTCSKCKLRITPTEKKILRLLLDYGNEWSIVERYKRNLSAMIIKLTKKGLIKLGRLTYDGKLLANTYPKVIDPFDVARHKPKGRTKRKTSR